MCINWKVVAGLAAVGLAIYILVPNVIAAALPLLLVLACPLSMLLMGRAMMGGMQQPRQVAQPQQVGQPRQVAQLGAASQYTCPMHPQVSAAAPGPCPRCGMALAPAEPPRQVPAPRPDGATALTREEQLALLKAQLERLTEQQAALAGEIEQLQQAEPWTAQVEPERPAEAETRPSKGALLLQALRRELRGDPAAARPSQPLQGAEQGTRNADSRR